MRHESEVSRARWARERNNVSDIINSSGKLDQPLKPEPEACVRNYTHTITKTLHQPLIFSIFRFPTLTIYWRFKKKWFRSRKETWTIAAEVEVPPVALLVEFQLIKPRFQHFKPFLSLASTYQLPYLFFLPSFITKTTYQTSFLFVC